MIDLAENNGSGAAPAPSDVPAFTLRSFKEIQVGLPPSYWKKYVGIKTSNILRKIREGVRVKVLAQSVGHQKNPCEELWLMVRHQDRKAGKYVGEVFTETDPLRTAYHGLHRGMLIRFEKKHILDVWLADLS